MKLLVSVLTRNALYGSWFNRPPGICPCPLYTPPVALTDGLLCEFEGLAFLLWKLKRTVWSKGKRSRNKASVGEPADGSLRCFFSFKTILSNFKITFFFFLLVFIFLFFSLFFFFLFKYKKKNRKEERNKKNKRKQKEIKGLLPKFLFTYFFLEYLFFLFEIQKKKCNSKFVFFF